MSRRSFALLLCVALALAGSVQAQENSTDAAPVTGPANAASAPPVFRSQAEEDRYRALTQQLRCVMCQNQSLADSNAQIAHDLRLEVLAQMREGKSDEQIKEYLVARYTDFVLYRPEVKPDTWLLWFGPAIVLLAGAVAVAMIVRRRAASAPPEAPREDSQEW